MLWSTDNNLRLGGCRIAKHKATKNLKLFLIVTFGKRNVSLIW